MDTMKFEKWAEIERRINNAFYHLKVSEENGTHPCPLVLLGELGVIKSNYDYIDNHCVIK